MCSSVDTSSLIKEVECSICLEQLSNPKTLQCHHSFCKECLDCLLQFEHNNNTCIIQCPLKCKHVTVLQYDETTNSLPTNYNLRRIIDLIEDSTMQDKTSVLCQGKDKCNRDVYKWCVLSKQLLCRNCWVEYLSNIEEGHKACDVRYSNVLERITPFCEEHETFSNYVCATCQNKFICLYCKEREHKTHHVETLKRSADLIRLWVKSYQNKRNRSTNTKQLYQSNYNSSKEQMNLFRENMMIELKKRKLQHISHQLLLLKDEEDKLLNKFDEAMLSLDKITKENCRTSHVSDDIQKKTDYQVILENVQIKTELYNLNDEILCPSFNAQLTIIGNDSKTKLGSLNIDTNVDVCNSEEINAHKFFHCLTPDETVVNYKPLIDVLEEDQIFITEFENALSLKSELNPCAQEFVTESLSSSILDPNAKEFSFANTG